MKRVMTIEYLKCRADLNFEVDFGVNNDNDNESDNDNDNEISLFRHK